MNQLQVLQQLKKLLSERRFFGDVSEPLAFVDVVISEASILELFASSDAQLPMAKLSAGSVSWSRKIQGYSDAMSYDVTVACEVEGDALGEHVMIGGAIDASVIGPDGRGVLELGEEVLETLKLVDPRLGLSLQLKSEGQSQAAPIDSTRWIAERTYTFTGKGTASAFFFPARRFRNTAFVFTWELPPAQFGFTGMILRRAAGSTAPDTMTAGDAVAISDPLTDTGVTDTPGAGTFSYALFAGYNLREGTTANRASKALTIEGI